jgi:hypothetical protein
MLKQKSPVTGWVPDRVIKSVINSVIPKSLNRIGLIALKYDPSESRIEDGGAWLPPLIGCYDTAADEAPPPPDNRPEEEASLDLQQDEDRPGASVIRPLVEQLRQINSRLSALELSNASSAASSKRGGTASESPSSRIWRWLGFGGGGNDDEGRPVSSRDILLSSGVLSVSAGAMAAALAYGVLSRWEKVRRG